MIVVGRRSTTLVVALLLLPLLSAISYEMGMDVSPVVSAASDCSANSQPGAIDSEEVEDFILQNNGVYFDPYYGDPDRYEDEGSGYWEGQSGPTKYDLRPLTSSFYTSFAMVNDTAVGLRMNMTTGWKYTICVDLQPLNGSTADPIADVYLLQENEYSKYESDYSSRYDEWDGMRDDLAHSPPWLQNLILWHPFRDVHSYEELDEVQFSVALDHAEQSYSIWDDYAEPETMFLMIESWDNIRDYDSKPQGSNYSVDVTVLVEERFSLPNWTVSIVCCGGLLALLASPFLLHRRYMKAGLVIADVGGADMMPHLDTAPEKVRTMEQSLPNMVEPPQGSS